MSESRPQARTPFDNVVAAYKLPRPRGGMAAGQSSPDPPPQNRRPQTTTSTKTSGQVATTAHHQTGASRDNPILVADEAPRHSSRTRPHVSGVSAQASPRSDATSNPRAPSTHSPSSAPLRRASDYDQQSVSDEDSHSELSLQELREEIQHRDETITFLLAYVATMDRGVVPPSPRGAYTRQNATSLRNARARPTQSRPGNGRGAPTAHANDDSLQRHRASTA